jgi:hypothetical protein
MSKNTDLGSLINYIKGQVTGRLNAPAYTSATAFTGTIAGYLGFDTSGNILTSTAGFTGSGTTNYVTKFTGSTSLGNSLIYDNGTNVGIGTTAPTTIAGFTALTIDNYSSGSFIDLNNSGSMNFRFLSLSSIDQRILANSNLAVFTAGINRFNISSIGNIGVGNVNNTYKLDVTGDVNISGTYRVNGTAIGGVTGSGSTNFMPLWTSTTGLGNSIIYNSGGNLGINSTSNGYTLNVIRSASTQFNTSFKGGGSLINIMSRFMQDESTKRGIAIGYAYDFELISGIWATQDTGTLMLGVLVGSNYKSKISINTTTIALDIPSSSAGLGSGQLYNDGGYVRIV